MKDNAFGDDRIVRRQHDPGDPDRPLSELVLEAIDSHEADALSREDVRLYDRIDPDALDELFRPDADADLTVQFRVDDVDVSLWGDGTVEVRVTDRFERV